MFRTKSKTKSQRLLGPVLAGLIAAAPMAAAPSAADAAEKVLQLPIRTDGPKTLDPVAGSTTYENMAVSQIFETLLENKYSNPYEFEPRLLAKLPERLEDGKRYRFTLKEGVYFHDHPAFPDGKGRRLVTDDVFYSLKRIADGRYQFKNWWLLENTILGFDEFKESQNASGVTFDYDAPVEGFVKINDREFEIVLREPVYRFLWVLTMFQTSIVPREVVEFYPNRDDFGFNPAGTGPFKLVDFTPRRRLIVERNENYHEVRYPARDEWSRDDRRARMHMAAGERVPFVDRIEFTMYVEDQPMWLDFNRGRIAYVEVPAEYFDQAFIRQTRQLRPEFAQRGVTYQANELLDFIFRGFNMDDPIVGGLDDRGRKLRQAINLAIDLEEFSEAFYNGLTVQYDGPIPPGLDGHPEGGRAPVSYRGPNLELARRKLAEAGYPEGRGLPQLQFYTSIGGNNAQQVEMLRRHLARVNIRLEPILVDFSTLIEATNNRRAQIFGFAWASDYPDAENNLALFYGPNEAPGSNHYNYKNPEYDALYERVRVMEPGPERTALYEKMRDMLIEDAPFVGSMARTRYYLVNPWAVNMRPTERYWSWFKYVDVDDSKR